MLLLHLTVVREHADDFPEREERLVDKPTLYLTLTVGVREADALRPREVHKT